MIDARDYLFQIPMFAKKKNSLSDLKVWMDRLRIDEEKMKIIHVAGTNGKGSVCAFLTSVLTTSGYRTGTFISPHLSDIRERFLIQGTMVDEGIFQSAFEKVYELNIQMIEEEYCHLTFFEYVFLMAMWIFQFLNVEIVILETGMGGRLDATNVISHPLMTVITSISLDHTQYLGDTIEQIALEKAGIIKTGIPVVFEHGADKIFQVLKAQADHLSAPVLALKEEYYKVLRRYHNCIECVLNIPNQQALTVQVPFAADYQVQNAMLAIMALRNLEFDKISPNSILQGISSARWPGRMEEVLPDVYLDGAHNAGGIKAFINTVKTMQEERLFSPILLFAVMKDKEYSEMVSLLCGKIRWKMVIVVDVYQERGVKKEYLAEIFQRECMSIVSTFGDVEGAVSYALSKKNENDLLFCTGSLYLIGEIQAVLRRETDD